MKLIRGWEAQYAPGVTGGLRLRKASEYRAMEDDEGVGDMQGQLRVATLFHEHSGSCIPDLASHRKGTTGGLGENGSSYTTAV